AAVCPARVRASAAPASASARTSKNVRACSTSRTTPLPLHPRKRSITLDIGISPSSATVESPSAIYEAGRREWNERYGSYISRARHWRLIAMVLAGTTAVSTCCAVWMAGQAHVVPYVVEVNKLGESLAVHRVVAAPPIDAGRVRSQLARWVVDMRTVYSDPEAVRGDGIEALAWVEHGSDAFAQVTTMLRDNPPIVRGAKESVGVSIESVGQIGADTWSIDWTEET